MYDDHAGRSAALDTAFSSAIKLPTTHSATSAPHHSISNTAGIAPRPMFNQPVINDGYLWWYTDALSDDGRYGLTLIALVGNVFSPYYAKARQRGEMNPNDYCAINVAIYDRHTNKGLWAMTERGQRQLFRNQHELAIGPSQLRWEHDTVIIQLDEIATPLPRRVRGEIRIHPRALTTHHQQLDYHGRHYWWPIAPDAQVEVRLQYPSIHWSGAGYLDSNWGDEPIAAGFIDWDWSRAKLRHHTAVLYDVRRRQGDPLALALRFNRHGEAEPFNPPPRQSLPPTFWWKIARTMQSDNNSRVLETLEDTPFYARSTLQAHLLGESVSAVHESLSLERFIQPWVQLLLPVRMPRRA
ncbi:carotenoid 1,2-hydratase [Thiospirillum jenense]|nr:carotenoid 1,2-hydratase [Thiospirillum jenense]